MQVKLTLSETEDIKETVESGQQSLKIELSNFIVILSAMRLMAEWKG